MRLTDEQIELYSRQIILREVGGTGQVALRDARVVVLGDGPAAESCVSYLVGAGVGAVATALAGPAVAPATDGLGLPAPQRRTPDAGVAVALLDRGTSTSTAPFDVVVALAAAASDVTEARIDARQGTILLRERNGTLQLVLIARDGGCPSCLGLSDPSPGGAATPPSAIALASAGALAALVCCDWLLGVGGHAGVRVLALAAGSGIWTEDPPPSRLACPRGCPPPAQPV